MRAPRMGTAALLAIAALALLTPLDARAQGSRKDDIVFNSRGVPLAGATVRVCTMPASGQPCTPLALIYSDVALTQALANPATTDGLGNYFFYAAPGKYEIEISGPGITTKQIPNVILPSDPTAPTFATLSTTSGITAFSLTLTGNLTVSGSASVTGNLSGGTVTLANQATAPGAPAAGLVNLYTKTADKRLYYKDEIGTEIGPIANTSGAQTNVTNTFSALQNFDAGIASKGPSPWFDISRYGGIPFAGTPQSTTGTISAASTSLSLASAIDFANGQGIVIYKAGPATSLQTPIAPTVAPIGIINGATTYNYQVVAEDFNGGLTPASPTGTTTVGASALGATPATLVSAARAGGVLTFTTSAAHNFSPGITVSITNALLNGFSSAECNGTLAIVATPTSTTFTVNQSGRPDNTSVCTGGTATVLAGNKLTWYTSTGGGNPNLTTQSNTIRWWIYRNNALVGVASGPDTYFIDYGYSLTANPAYIPSTPPASAQPGFLSTTISSGGGTTTLTLAASATTAATAQNVLHDTAPAILAAANAAITAGGGAVYVPPVSGSTTTYPINSTLVMPNSSGAYVRLLFNGGITVNEPIILHNLYSVEGLPGSGGFNATPPFTSSSYVVIGGTATPFFYSICHFGMSFKNIFIQAAQNQQVGILMGGNGNNSVNCANTTVSYTDTFVQTTGTGGEPLRVTGGGFGHYFLRGGFVQSQGANQALSPPSMHFTSMNVQGPGAVTGIIYLYQTFLNQQGIKFDTEENSTGIPQGPSTVSLSNLLYENFAGPLIRINVGGNASFGQYAVSNTQNADTQVGGATPMFDLTGGTGNISGFTVQNATNGSAANPIFAGTVSSAFIISAPTQTVGLSGGYQQVFNTTNVPVAGTGNYFENTLPFTMKNNPPLLWNMPSPAAPTATVQAGGSLAVNTYNYFLAALDVDGLTGNGNGDTVPSLPSNTCTTTTGNQKCALTWTTVSGAAGYRLWRGTSPFLSNCGCNWTLITGGSTASFTDDGTVSFAGGTVPQVTNAGLVKLRQSGMLLNGENISAAPRSIFSAFLPGAMTSAWTGATLTLDKAITVTRMQVQAKTAPSGCATNAVVRLTDGASPLNVTLSAAANDSGAVAQNYAAGAVLTISVQTAASGCTTSPADANVAVQYRMQ